MSYGDLEDLFEDLPGLAWKHEGAFVNRYAAGNPFDYEHAMLSRAAREVGDAIVRSRNPTFWRFERDADLLRLTVDCRVMTEGELRAALLKAYRAGIDSRPIGSIRFDHPEQPGPLESGFLALRCSNGPDCPHEIRAGRPVEYAVRKEAASARYLCDSCGGRKQGGKVGKAPL